MILQPPAAPRELQTPLVVTLHLHVCQMRNHITSKCHVAIQEGEARGQRTLRCMSRTVCGRMAAPVACRMSLRPGQTCNVMQQLRLFAKEPGLHAPSPSEQNWNTIRNTSHTFQRLHREASCSDQRPTRGCHYSLHQPSPMFPVALPATEAHSTSYFYHTLPIPLFTQLSTRHPPHALKYIQLLHKPVRRGA